MSLLMDLILVLLANTLDMKKNSERFLEMLWCKS
jgi:hypothetical protein